MVREEKNNIGNLSFQLLYKGSADGIEVKKTTEHIVDHRFLPALEQLIDTYSPVDEVITIDSIVCDVTVDSGELNDALVKKIMAQLEKQLLAKIAPAQTGNGKPPTTRERFIKTLLFYLKNGYMPWWAAISSKRELNEMVSGLSEMEWQRSDSVEFLVLLKTENVVLRICNDLDDEVFWELLTLPPFHQKYPAIIAAWKKDHQIFAADGLGGSAWAAFSFVYKKNILKALASIQASVGETGGIELSELFAGFFTSREVQMIPVKLADKMADPIFSARIKFSVEQEKNTLEQTSEKEKTGSEEDNPAVPKDRNKLLAQEEKEDQPAGEAVYINNSGLVIVAAYLGMFFKKLGIVEDDKITDTTRAITLLHYIASGNTAFAEFEIALPKLLCGVGLEEAVKSRYVITEEDIVIVDELLHAVIANWSILKNTSIDGLRDTFLMREGKLAFKGSGYHLKVQEQAVDVLVQHLPWSISMIKLSWMQYLLMVDWI